MIVIQLPLFDLLLERVVFLSLGMLLFECLPRSLLLAFRNQTLGDLVRALPQPLRGCHARRWRCGLLPDLLLYRSHRTQLTNGAALGGLTSKPLEPDCI